MTFIATDLTKYSKSTTGTYTGDNTVNRAIPHGLGSTPRLVIILSSNYTRQYYLPIGTAKVFCIYPSISVEHAVTAIDSTNFYVGNATSHGQSGNEGSIVLYWIAFA